MSIMLVLSIQNILHMKEGLIPMVQIPFKLKNKLLLMLEQQT